MRWRGSTWRYATASGCDEGCCREGGRARPGLRCYVPQLPSMRVRSARGMASLCRLTPVVQAIVPYIMKFKRHPVTGEPLALKDLTRLNFSRNADGEFNCPVTGKVRSRTESMPP